MIKKEKTRHDGRVSLYCRASSGGRLAHASPVVSGLNIQFSGGYVTPKKSRKEGE